MGVAGAETATPAGSTFEVGVAHAERIAEKVSNEQGRARIPDKLAKKNDSRQRFVMTGPQGRHGTLPCHGSFCECRRAQSRR